jgi:hypothetical protein
MNKSTLSTIIGLVVAIANAWVNVDWDNFMWNTQHIAPLVVSGLIALGGYMTKIENPVKKKNNESN